MRAEQNPRRDHWPATWYMLFLRIGVLVLAAYLLYRVSAIVVMVLVSSMLALTLAPCVDLLLRLPVARLIPHHLRRGVVAAVVFVGMAAALVLVLALVLRPMATEVQLFLANWKSHQAHWQQLAEGWQRWYAAQVPVEVRTWLDTDGRAWLQEHGARDFGATVGERLQHLAAETVDWGMIVVELILIPVLAFSFLTEGRPLRREFLLLVPRERLRDGVNVMRLSGSILQSYAIGQLILAVIAGVVVYLLMVALGVRYALALGVIAAVTRVIPVIGPILGGIPIVLIASLQGVQQGIAVLLAFSLMHLIESKVVMPRLIGHKINLHPALVIIALLVGAEFFGMWGMFLAAPVAALIKALLHYFFVRPRRSRRRGAPAAPADLSLEDPQLGHPAVSGAWPHSGAHGVHPGQ